MAKSVIYMTPDEVRETRIEIENLERMLANDRASKNPKIQDEVEFKSEIRKKRELLEKHAPKKLTGERANKALREAKELESELRESLLNSRDYYQSQPKNGSTLDFERAVNEEMRRMKDKAYKNKIIRYKSLMRQLDPEDPTITNIERFRR